MKRSFFISAECSVERVTQSPSRQEQTTGGGFIRGELLALSNQQLLLCLIIDNLTGEVRGVPFVDSRYVYSTTHKLLDEQLVVHGTHRCPSVITNGLIKNVN
jgi:hypothetical protein